MDNDLPTVHITKLKVNSGEFGDHVEWLTRLMMAGVDSSGVLSAEIIPPAAAGNNEWTLLQRFHNPALIDEWRTSDAYIKLIEELAPRLESADVDLSETAESDHSTAGSVAVAIVTNVKPGQEDSYRKCEASFQSAQARRPGYRGVYLQPPTRGTPGLWTTLVRFDSPDALDKWFASDERQKLLEKSDPVVNSTDYKLVTTSFPGWFPSQVTGAKGPPNWKTALLVLLGLYPIVMLEIRYFMPLLHGLPPAIASFIGNVLSVSLTTWVTMPASIKGFNSWLFPTAKTPKWMNSASAIVLLCLYAIEIAVLWRLP